MDWTDWQSGAEQPASVFAAAFQAPEHLPFSWEAGASAPAALLVHGFPGTPVEMRPLAQALHAVGWSVQGLLLPGLGPQIGRLFEVRQAEWQAAVRQALRSLMASGRPVIIVGFSLGGALALEAAAAEKPAGAVLLAPFHRLPGALWRMLPVLRHALPKVQPFRLRPPDFSNNEFRAGVRKIIPDLNLDDPQVQQGMREFTVPIGFFDEIRRAGQAAWRSAPRLEAPCLVVQGLQDELVLPKITRRLALRLGNAERRNAIFQYAELPARHDLPDATKPAWEEVQRLVLGFAHNVCQNRPL